LSGVLIIVVTLMMPGGIYGAFVAWRSRQSQVASDGDKVQEQRV